MTTIETRGACPDPEQLTAYVDAELGERESGTVAAHVASCTTCGPVVEAERAVKASLAGSTRIAMPAGLESRLRAIPAVVGAESADGADGPVAEPVPITAARRRHTVPAYLSAAASVVVLLVGAFLFIGATGSDAPGSEPTRATAIVPAPDRLAEEHAATTVQTGFGGAGVSTVPVSLNRPVPSAAAR